MKQKINFLVAILLALIILPAVTLAAPHTFSFKHGETSIQLSGDEKTSIQFLAHVLQGTNATVTNVENPPRIVIDFYGKDLGFSKSLSLVLGGEFNTKQVN